MSLTKVSYSMIDGAPVAVKDYGVVGDGVTNDLQSLIDLFNDMPSSHFTVDFQNLPIYLGSVTTNNTALITITGKKFIKFVNVGLITADNNISGGSYPNWTSVFRFVDCSHLDLEMNCEFSPYFAQSGLINPIEIMTTTSATDQIDYKIKSSVVNGHAALLVNRPADDLLGPLVNPPYATDFQVDLYGENVNYGLSCVYNGANVTGNIRTNTAVRSYFPVDTYNHNVKVASLNHNKFTDILIKSYWADVHDISLEYVGTNDTSIDGGIFTLEFQNNTENTSITNINAKISSNKTEAVNLYTAIKLSSQFNSAGVSQTTTNSVTDNIVLDLNLPEINGKNAISVSSTATKGGTVTIVGDKYSCKKTNGLTFIKGDVMLSNNVGAFSSVLNGNLYFFLGALYSLNNVYCELEIYSQPDTTTSASAYQKTNFILAMDGSGNITASSLTLLDQYLFSVASGPSISLSNPSPFLLVVTPSNSLFNGANAAVGGKLRIIGQVV